MKYAICIDTETTGKWNFKLPPDHATQPRACQIATAVVDENASVKARFSSLIIPDGWKIDPEAAAVNKLSDELCCAVGMPILCVLQILEMMASKCTMVIAHNLDFDEAVVQNEYRKKDLSKNAMAGLERFCTMKASAPILKIAGKYGDFKWPKLAETHRHFFKCDFDGAHDAMADVEACLKCYFAIKAFLAPPVVPDPVAVESK